MENKEFKVGDKVYVECSVINTNNEHIYPIITSTEEGNLLSFTKDGRFMKSNSIPVLKHIEDIIPKPELPKWMMVSDDSKEWNKRFVVYNDSHTVVACCNGKTSTVHGVVMWKYVKEIESENTLKEELLQKAQELIDVANELKNKAKEIK